MTRKELLAKYPPEKYNPVLVTEVTRMSKGTYCVAGLALATGKMLRPLQANGNNWSLGKDRSVFGVGHVIACRPTGQSGTVKPHSLEDTPLKATPSLLEELTEDQTYKLLIGSTAPSVAAGFGVELEDNKYVIAETNCPSLVGIRAERRSMRFHESYGKLRLSLDDTDGEYYDAKVTCDTLQHVFSPGDESAEPHFGAAEANEWLEVNDDDDELIIRIGLARPWDGPQKSWDPKRCYLQVNGIICPQDNYHIFAGPPST